MKESDNKGFTPFMNRKLDYEDIGDLLLICLLCRKTWNTNTLWFSTSKLWNQFKDQFPNRQKIMFRNAIIELRESFKNNMQEDNWYWLSSTPLIVQLETTLVPKIMDLNYRKKVVKETTNPLV